MIGGISPVSLASRAVYTAISPLLAPMRVEPVITSPVPFEKVNWKKKIIVFWVPGTSNHSVPEEFESFAREYWGKDVEIVLCDYAATWQFNDSIPDGIRVLTQTLDFAAKKKRPGQKFYVAGESQGALIASEVVTQGHYSKIVDKTALMGHPGIAPKHFHDKNDKILEINNALDPATFEWKGDYHELLDAVDRLTKADPSGIPILLRAALNNPVYAIALALLQLQNVSAFRNLLTNTHNYRDRMEYAVLWLNGK